MINVKNNYEKYKNCSWNKESYSSLVDCLKSSAEKEYRKFQSNLIPNIDNLLGIRIPVLRNIAKYISKGDWREYFKFCRDDYYEEIMLQGLVLNDIKTNFEEIFKYMDIFIAKIDNWAVCDTFCCGMKVVKKNREVFFPYIQALLLSDKEFYVRTGLILILAHYIDDDYIDKILEISDSVCQEAYYVRMANAWLIASCFSKYRDKIMNFIQNNHLDDWTHNKAIQKIIESKTTLSEEKEILKRLKR